MSLKIAVGQSCVGEFLNTNRIQVSAARRAGLHRLCFEPAAAAAVAQPLTNTSW